MVGDLEGSFRLDSPGEAGLASQGLVFPARVRDNRYWRAEAPSVAPEAIHPTPGQGPRNYSRPATLVLDEAARVLASHPMIEASRLAIECGDDGIVHISGTVETRDTALLITGVLSEVLGVTDVDLSSLSIDRGVESAYREFAEKSSRERGSSATAAADEESDSRNRTQDHR